MSRGSRGLAAAVFAAGAGLPLTPAPGSAQQDVSLEECRFVAPSGNLISRQIAPNNRLDRVMTPSLVCAGGVRIQAADSARRFTANQVYVMFGRTVYEDEERRLTADLMRWFRQSGQLEAVGDAELVRKSDGTVVTADRLDFFEAGGTRPEDELVATQVQPSQRRPHVTFFPDSAGGGSPFEIDADRLTFRGEERLVASGDVEVVRDSLQGFSTAAEFDETENLMVLRENAILLTRGTELAGDSIHATLEAGEIRDLIARSEATLVGEGFEVAAPVIRVFVADEVIERLVAVGLPPEGPPGLEEEALPDPGVDPFEAEHPVRPVVRSDSVGLVGDSVEILIARERVDRIVAMGAARAESAGRDTLNTPETPEIARKDWIEGDTVIAVFTEKLPDRDEILVGPPLPGEEPVSTGEAELDSLIAKVGARALQRLAASDTAEARAGMTPGVARPAISYVRGSVITVVMRDGEASAMFVQGRTTGVYLEPTAVSEFLRTEGPDTTGRDSMAIPDTGRIDRLEREPPAAGVAGGPSVEAERTPGKPGEPPRRGHTPLDGPRADAYPSRAPRTGPVARSKGG